jgi:hypothetical protein
MTEIVQDYCILMGAVTLMCAVFDLPKKYVMWGSRR